jgi:hypothetical protein
MGNHTNPLEEVVSDVSLLSQFLSHLLTVARVGNPQGQGLHSGGDHEVLVGLNISAYRHRYEFWLDIWPDPDHIFPVLEEELHGQLFVLSDY